MPTRDIIYLANKDRAAAPGYAHLTTVRELYDLVALCGLRDHSIVTPEAELLSGRLRPVRWAHRGYSMWLVLRKPVRP